MLAILFFAAACAWAFFAPTLGVWCAEWLYGREQERWRQAHPDSPLRY